MKINKLLILLAAGIFFTTTKPTIYTLRFYKNFVHLNGCNKYRAKYTIDGERVEIKPFRLHSKEKCSQEILQKEKSIISKLEKATSYQHSKSSRPEGTEGSLTIISERINSRGKKQKAETNFKASNYPEKFLYQPGIKGIEWVLDTSKETKPIRLPLGFIN